jgi:hypothetical protein
VRLRNQDLDQRTIHDPALKLPKSTRRIQASARCIVAVAVAFALGHRDAEFSPAVGLTYREIRLPDGISIHDKREALAPGLALGPATVTWKNGSIRIETQSLHRIHHSEESADLAERVRGIKLFTRYYRQSIRTLLEPLARDLLAHWRRRLAFTLIVQSPVAFEHAGTNIRIRDFTIEGSEKLIHFGGSAEVDSAYWQQQFDLRQWQTRVDISSTTPRFLFELPDETTRRKIQGIFTPARSGERFSLALAEEDSSAALQAEVAVAPSLEVKIVGHDFPVAALRPFFSFLQSSNARWTGVIRASHPRKGVALLHFESNQITDLAVSSPQLGENPITISNLKWEGDLRRHDRLVDSNLSFTYRDILLELRSHSEGTLFWPMNKVPQWYRAMGSPDQRVEIDVKIAPTTCQAVLDALRSSFAESLAGMRVDGELSGSIRSAWRGDELLAFNETEAIRPGSKPTPGTFEFNFPIREACKILQPPSTLDLEGLIKGTSRHEFIDDDIHHSQLLSGRDPTFIKIANSGHLAQAFVFLEDSHFWQHDGFDREQMQRAWWVNLAQSGFHRGGSTISQQVARMLWLGTQRSLARKIQEVALTAVLEDQLSKSRILEIYLNLIELGPQVYGIHDAAHYYFGKDVSELNWLQALHLAKLAPSPLRYAQRFANGEIDAKWRSELDSQLDRLVIHGLMSSATAAHYKEAPLELLRH